MKDLSIAFIIAAAVAHLAALRYERDARTGSGRLVMRWEEAHIVLGALAGMTSLLVAKGGRA